MSKTPDNYMEEVPSHVEMSQKEWEKLSYHGQYYRAEKRREIKRKTRRKRRKKKREWLDKVKGTKSCQKCGEDESVCLDFHHKEAKDFELSQAVNRDKSYEDIKNEIEKCVVLCANCHRKHHAGLIDV